MKRSARGQREWLDLLLEKRLPVGESPSPMRLLLTEERPEDAEDVEDLVALAKQIKAVDHPRLRVSDLERGRLRVESVARARQLSYRPHIPAVSPSRRFFRYASFFGWRSTAAVLAASVLVGWGTVTAAADSYPDSPLYGIKLASEQAYLALSPDQRSRSRLHLEYARRRLSEAEALAREGGATFSLLNACGQELALAVGAGQSSTPVNHVVIDDAVHTARRALVLAQNDDTDGNAVASPLMSVALALGIAERPIAGVASGNAGNAGIEQPAISGVVPRPEAARPQPDPTAKPTLKGSTTRPGVSSSGVAHRSASDGRQAHDELSKNADLDSKNGDWSGPPRRGARRSNAEVVQSAMSANPTQSTTPNPEERSSTPSRGKGRASSDGPAHPAAADRPKSGGKPTTDPKPAPGADSKFDSADTPRPDNGHGPSKPRDATHPEQPDKKHDKSGRPTPEKGRDKTPPSGKEKGPDK